LRLSEAIRGERFSGVMRLLDSWGDDLLCSGVGDCWRLRCSGVEWRLFEILLRGSPWRLPGEDGQRIGECFFGRDVESPGERLRERLYLAEW